MMMMMKKMKMKSVVFWWISKTLEWLRIKRDREATDETVRGQIELIDTRK